MGRTPRKRPRDPLRTGRHPAGWVVTDHVVINGRHVTPGTELSFTGLRGRYRFVRQVTTPAAVWLDVVGPLDSPRSRSFRPGRVKTVHRK